MKQLAKKLLLVGALVTASSSASAFFDMDCMSPYVGIDYQQRWLKNRSGDDGSRSRSFPGFNAYLGGRWDCFGLEVGGHYGAQKRSINGVGRNFSIGGGYLDLVGYLPAMDCFEFMGTLGVGYDSAKVHRRINATTVESRTINGFVVRVRAGGNYMFSDCVGVRGLIGYESTSTMRRRGGDGSNYRLGDSFLASLGVFFKFQ